MNCVLFAKMDQVFSKENKTLKKYWKIGKKYWKSQGILSVRKSGNPEYREPVMGGTSQYYIQATPVVQHRELAIDGHLSILDKLQFLPYINGTSPGRPLLVLRPKYICHII